MTRGTHSLAVAGLLNMLALSALFIGNAGWLYERRSYDEFSTLPWNDAPHESRPLLPRDDEIAANDDHTDDDDDTTQIMAHASTAADSSSRVLVPAHLKWEEGAPPPPQDWSFQMPKFCNTANNTNNNFHHTSHSLKSQQTIIVHYHMQHNAGTEFYQFARQFTPCATRACWQTSKHCMVSYNETVEAENIRQNYNKYGVQYVSYELMLPPRFPLPFVSEDARRGLFFTTILRDPFKVRAISSCRPDIVYTLSLSLDGMTSISFVSGF